MKKTVANFLSIMILAAATQAFALPAEDPARAKKTNATADSTTCMPAPEKNVGGQDKRDQETEREKARRKKIREQEQQWLHDVSNIVAG